MKMHPPTVGIFIVDSDMTCRATIRRHLSGDRNLSVVGSANSEEEAIDCLRRTDPQIVLLEERGDLVASARFLNEIEQLQRNIQTIACVPYDSPQSIEDRLRKMGVAMVVRKWNPANGSKAPTEYMNSLLETIDVLSTPDRIPSNKGTTSLSEPFAGVPRDWLFHRPPSLVAIGCSTGGPEALGQLLQPLSSDFDTPIVIVQHIPANFAPRLASRLSTISQRPVQVAEHGMPLLHGMRVLAPGDYHMRVVGTAGRATIELSQDEKVQSCRPAVDVLFQSIAKSFGKSALGIVLTGMGCDGAEGAKALAATQADIWVQDQASSVVWGMPKSALELCPNAKVMDIPTMSSLLHRMHHLRR